MDLTYDATSRTVDTPVGALHYHEAGDGPPLVLLHGSGPGVSAWANFRDNLGAFAEHFRTIALDFPGFGTSAPCDDNPLAVAPGAVTALLDALELGPVPVLGNSMGGNVAARVAAAEPERITRLVTIGGLGVGLFSASPPEGVKLLVQFVEDPTRDRLVAWMESMVFDPAILTDEFVELRWRTANDPAALADVRRMFNPKVLAAMRRAPLGAPDQVATLARIKAPTLVTWGRDDRVTPLDNVLLPLRVIRDCEVHVFPDCGHWAMIERKDEFERVVLEYLLRGR
ncbi:alpha/beta fold hydrolase [Dermatobacter hominis]|uniref:alpha/beta fold hydrolase n=1 Tax=Dermatobacter hominis TaxID=2884263 RepID=UPI001D10508D|nr:alpha/beta fold hydrolase [Dermatobacter hominis]UDY36689.1 alpha/beta fold hydrolase [Dermatobacter hominis]